MPSSQKAEFKFVAVKDLQGLGANEGPGIVYQWSPPSPIPGLIPWLALLILLALPANRTLKAWWIVVPVAVLVLAALKVDAVLSSLNIAPGAEFGRIYKALAMSAAAVWLLLPYLKKSYRILSYLLMLVVWGLGGAAAFIIGAVFSLGDETTLPMLITLAVLTFCTVAAFVLSGLLCRKHYRPVRLAVWPAVFLGALPLIVTVPIILIANAAGGLVPWKEVIGAILGVSEGCYLVLLSFLVLSFANSHFRRGLKELLHLDSDPKPPGQPLPPPAAAPAPEPMERTSV